LANAELVGLPSLSEQAEAVSHAEGEEGLYGERQDIEILLCLLLIGVFTPARGNPESLEIDEIGLGCPCEDVGGPFFLPGHSLDRTWPCLIADCNEGRFQQVPCHLDKRPSACFT
jgi:hypothetical protein